MLINTLTTAPGWIEWGYQKRNINHLRQHGMTQVSDNQHFALFFHELNLNFQFTLFDITL